MDEYSLKIGLESTFDNGKVVDLRLSDEKQSSQNHINTPVV